MKPYWVLVMTPSLNAHKPPLVKFSDFRISPYLLVGLNFLSFFHLFIHHKLSNVHLTCTTGPAWGPLHFFYSLAPPCFLPFFGNRGQSNQFSLKEPSIFPVGAI